MPKRTLSYFLQSSLARHPEVYSAKDKVFIPNPGERIRLLFDGGLQIEGDTETLEINFNFPEFLIINYYQDGARHIVSSLRSRLIAFDCWKQSDAKRMVPITTQLN